MSGGCLLSHARRRLNMLRILRPTSAVRRSPGSSTSSSLSTAIRPATRRGGEDARPSQSVGKNDPVALQRIDNVGIVVESLDAAIAFFAELGLELEGRTMIEGEWSGRVTGLHGQQVEIAMMRTPDGHGRIELSRFLTPPTVA